jgi:ferric-dicitrate binding protein FerR (iron transport regulator)
MNEPDPLKDLIDDYLSGLLDEARLKELEDGLCADPEARRYFVRYARLHTDLHMEMRARQASDRALDQIDQLVKDRGAPGAAAVPSRAETSGARPGVGLGRWFAPQMLALAACLVLAFGAGWWWWPGRPTATGAGGEPAIAWLVNAQNCRWSAGEPGGNMQAGKVLQLERGLAEIRFWSGARVVLEGPASVELLSGKSVRLRYGKLTARVPVQATGFEVLSPQGRVIDLGTEFGIAVSDQGATEVYVFEGQVEARATDNGPVDGVSLTQHQAAHIAAGKVTVRPVAPEAGPGQFVRAIVPPPVIVPRTLRLTFDRLAAGGIRDVDGAATGLTHRLPGTGRRLPERDPNLRLDNSKGQLELTTTRSDLNTQHRLDQGEYLGFRLSDLGFTGKEDFAVTAAIPDIPALESVGQFGLYAGARSDKNIRGGLISRRGQRGQYTQFLVNNHGGSDTNPNWVGLLSTGDDLRLTLQRRGGKYALTVENQTTGASSTLSVRHPEFLDGEADLYIGLFGANTQSDVRKTLIIKEFAVTVWTVAPAGEAGPAD